LTTKGKYSIQGLMPRRKAKVEEVMNEVAEVRPADTKVMAGKWVTMGWVLLLIGGLAHMLPEQMAPVLKYAAFGVTVQMAVGVVSVVLALYYLLED